ncbi:MAG: primosomal protein N' [Candidatus Puniceispirillaceae bacterium]
MTQSQKTHQQIYQVAVPLPVRHDGILVYDYLAGSFTGLVRGTIISVPLGQRHVWGIIMAETGTPDIAPDKLKSVSAVADCPPLHEAHLQFLTEVASWTCAPFGMVMKMMLSTPKAFEPPPLETIYGRNDDDGDDHHGKLTEKRARILNFVKDAPALAAADLARETGTSVGIVKKMAESGLLRAYQVPKISIMPQPNPDIATLTLTESQRQVADGISAYLETGFSAHLLDGVTGSGKTEVYFDLVAKQIAKRQQTLILLPEIALTAAWQLRFEARFGVKPLIWHSSVSETQRRQLWRACLSGEALVVVGARSALFLPFSQLGLMIVDEEHEAAFKQEDMVIYHARDMAVMRARAQNIPIILATATPSLESWVNAGKGSQDSDLPALPKRYHHWQLAARIGTAKLPDITMIDLKKDRPAAGRWLSDALQKAISQNLADGGQTLLYLNRRGYAPLAICEACGTKAKCHSCDSWLVTHRLSGSRQCHHCGYRQPLSDCCADCGTKGQMRAYGPGVERLAEEVGTLFADARYCIFSSDTAARPEVAAEMIRAITDGEVDIIIGTQMAAKGHHFPNLTLVGIIDADLGLQGGDLRAAERTYQMLSQASGRAGRAGTSGRALLQSYEPDNAVFTALASGDRDSFLALEMQMRHAATMPPFGRLAAIIISSQNQQQLEQFAQTLFKARPQFSQVDVFGPVAAPIARIRGRYRMRFLVRTGRQVALQKIIKDWVAQCRVPSQIHLQIDIDPYSFM